MTTYETAVAAIEAALTNPAPRSIDGARLRELLLALAEGIRDVEEDAGTAAAVLAAHAEAANPHPQYALVAALAALAALDSPHLIGIPTAPTAALGTNTAQIATMAAVKAAIDDLRSALMGGAPSAALDTLLELGNRLLTDEDAIAALVTSLAGKQPLAAGLTDLAGLSRTKGNIPVGNGAAWFALDISGIADGYVLTKDAASAGGMKWAAGGGSTPANVTWNTGGIIAQFTAASATDIPFVAKGAAGQTADLVRVTDSSGGIFFRVSSGGALITAGATAVFGAGLRPCLGGPAISAANATDLLLRDGSLGASVVLQLGAADTGLSRNAAGVVEVNNGTAGQRRDLTLRNLLFSDGSQLSTAARAESGQIAIDANTSHSFAHGLGAAPKRWGAVALCVTAANGYAVGDKITLGPDNGYTEITSLYATATTVALRTRGRCLTNDTSGAELNLCGNANFKLILWAEK